MPTLLENKGVFSPVINDSKILPRNSSGIPLPVSDMIILQNEYPSISIRFNLKNHLSIRRCILKRIR